MHNGEKGNNNGGVQGKSKDKKYKKGTEATIMKMEK